jgi:hypothetical protein
MTMAYSKKCEAAEKAMKDAKEQAKKVLAKEYPIDAKVRVTHSRGHFYGVVAQHCWDGLYMVVVNDDSGNSSKRYFRDVEVMP